MEQVIINFGLDVNIFLFEQETIILKAKFFLIHGL